MQVISLDLGVTVTSARDAAISAAMSIYKQAPINDARGQTFKNEFIKAFLNRSERAKQAASVIIIGKGSVKPIIGGYEEEVEDVEEEEDTLDEDYDDDFECTCCHCLDK